MTNNSIQNGGNGQTMMIDDPLFRSIPRNKAAFFVWRVENMQLNTVPKDSYGTFFKGDTYIVYSAETTSKSSPATLVQHIHLWIGSESTTDEQGIGAFKMVELDDYLGGAPIQHRECQNYESERFLSYFKQRGGIKYQNGGAACGFHHYEKKFEPRLFQLKGKRNVRLTEIMNMDWSALNRNDSFIIDLNTAVFIWNGRNSNKMERLQAVKKASMLKDERNGNCNIVVIEDGEEKELGKEELKLFESKFPLKEKMSKLKNDTANGAQDDLKFEREAASYLKLYKCSDAQDEEDGTIKIKIIEQKTGPLYKEDLNSEDAFIVDNGRAGIWVWIGRKSSPKERQEAMRNALGFLQAKGFDEKLQNSIKVTRVIEGAEPAEFRVLFNRWSDSNESRGLGRTYSQNVVAKTLQTKYDASTLHKNHQIAADSQMVDDGRGFKEVWYVQKFDLYRMDESRFGEFHSGDCYIVHYKYTIENNEKHILYYWIGRKSTLDEQGTVALKTIEMDNNEFGGEALQVRVCEGKEPNHFMALFDGRIVIYQGGKASGFHNTSESDSDKLPDNYMLQIRSFSHVNIKAFQVDYSAGSLNSNDVFIICYNKNNYFIWCGKGSTGDERETAKSIVQAQRREPSMVFESQERDEFWEILGGKLDYQSDKRLQMQGPMSVARLFEVSNASGKVTVQEIYQFTQDDLNPTNVMLLDAWDSIYIWIGSGANKVEIGESERIVGEYLRTDPSQRSADIPIFKIKQGFEPPMFTGFFGPWDPNYYQADADYNFMKQDLQSKNQPHLFQLAVKEKSLTGNLSRQNGLNSNFNEFPKYSYDVLIRPFDELPDDIITDSKEVHLTDDDFLKVFNMSYQQFIEKPAWKQRELKRGVRLF